MMTLGIDQNNTGLSKVLQHSTDPHLLYNHSIMINIELLKDGTGLDDIKCEAVE